VEMLRGLNRRGPRGAACSGFGSDIRFPPLFAMFVLPRPKGSQGRLMAADIRGMIAVFSCAANNQRKRHDASAPSISVLGCRRRRGPGDAAPRERAELSLPA